MARSLALRFDIDTAKCLRVGVPALLELGERAGCRFTFFANMGRAVAPRSFVGGRGGSPEGCEKLRPLSKLGAGCLLETVLLNPPVGARHPGILREVAAAGHELGLHGGRNHGAWQHGAGYWTPGRLASELDWGIAAFEAAVAFPPTAFASPGFTHPPSLEAELARRGFGYVADEHEPGRDALSRERGRVGGGQLGRANTNLLGSPGAVGFVEWCIARGMAPGACAEQFRSMSDRLASAILYDHPCLAGDRGLAHLEGIIDAALGSGWRVVTIEAMLASAAAP